MPCLAAGTMVCASWPVGFLPAVSCRCSCWGQILPAHSWEDLLRDVHQDLQEIHWYALREQQDLDSDELGYFRSCGKTHRPGLRGGFCIGRTSWSLICLLGWGQGLCEGGLCSDRLWALPPVPRQVYFKAKLHPSFRPSTLQAPLREPVSQDSEQS